MAFDPSKVDLSSLSQVSSGEDLDSDFNLGDDNLNFTMSEAIKVNPVAHAKNLDLGNQSGLPSFIVEDDPDVIEQDLKKSKFDFSNLRDDSPRTANYLTNIDNAIVAQEDVDVLQTIEDSLKSIKEYVTDIGESVETGLLSVESADIGLSRMYHSLGANEIISDEQIARLKEIEELTKKGTDEYGFFAGAPLAAAEQLPIMYEILSTGLGYAGAGAIPGALIGAAVGSTAAGAGAIPGAIAGAIPGAKIGGRVGVAKAAFDLEAGLAYNEFSAFKDEQGNILNPQIAGGAAAIVGAVNAGLEFISLAALGRTVTPVMRSLIKSKVKQSLATETGREVITRLMKSYGVAVATEAVTESAQEFVNVIGGELAKHIDKESFTEQGLSKALDNIFSIKTGERIIEAGTKGAQAALIFAGAGTSVSAVVESRQRERLSNSEQLRIDTLNENVKNVKMREHSKESFRQFVEQADGDNNTTVFIDGAQTSLYLQEFTTEEIAADPALKKLSEQSREASALGNDVQIPVADFATDLAGTDHFDALRDSMTLSGESVSPFRQEQVKQENETYVQNLMKEAQGNVSEYVEAQEIYTQVRDQLIDTGQVNAANASIMAQIVPAWATAQAVRQGKTVQQVYADSGLVIEGPQTGERARLEGVLEQARETGFEGDTRVEASEWQRAVDKGLDMSQDARLQRAEEMDLDTSTKYFHTTEAGDFKEFDKNRRGDTTLSNASDNAYGATSLVGDFFNIGSDVLTSGRYTGESIIPVYLPHQDDLKDVGSLASLVDDLRNEANKLNIDIDNVVNLYIDLKPIADSYSENLQSQGYKGVRFSDEEFGGTSVAIFEPSQIRSVNAAFDPDFKESAELLAQPPVEDRNLFVAHNLSAENIIAAKDLGGLAAPSIAIARADISDFTGFGEVTLLADPTLLEDPKARTFDADVYSPRQPRAVYDIDQDKYNELYVQLDPDNLGLSKPDLQSIEDTNGADNLLRSTAVEYHWLKLQGKEPKLKKAKIEPIIRKADKLGLHEFDMVEDPKFIKMVTDHYQKKLDNLKENGFDVRAERMIDWYFDEDDVIKHSKLRDMASEVRRFRDTDGNDVSKLREDIAKKIRTKSVRADYEQWVTEQFNNMVVGKKLFKGFTPSGNRKYVPYNMQNVVKEMTQKLQAGEDFFYGAGTVRSKYANEMKTIKQIQAKRSEIVSESDMEKVKEESSEVFSQALDDLKPFYKYETDSWSYANDAGEAIVEGRSGLNEAFNMTPEAQQIVDDLLEYLTALPTSYFETKIQRAVGFEEFNTAVVPRGMRRDALKVLKDAGLTIKTYDPKDDGSRADIIAKQKKLLFQTTNGKQPQARGYYDPANSIIRLTESADLSTFLHEFAHFMYEMEVSGDTEMLQSINSWYKRNAEDVAKEANSYLGEEFDSLKQTVFHGTPHRFDKFSLEAMGTGEGAQAWGWGLYFASDRGVAEWYRGILSGVSQHMGEEVSHSDVQNWKVNNQNEQDVVDILSSYLQDVEWDDPVNLRKVIRDSNHDLIDEFDNLAISNGIATEGQLFQADIPADDTLLDWDKSLNNQPKNVIKKLRAIPSENIHEAMQSFEMGASTGGTIQRVLERDWSMSVDYVVESDIKTATASEFASKYLGSIGIPGLRYLDGTSRGTDGDKYNYVIWDEDTVTIEAVNDELIAAEQFAQPTEPPTAKEGSITPDDVVTFLDNKTTGDKDKDSAIRRAVHEQFARGFETYLMEGEAPSVELRNAFRTFARWLTQIYQAVRGQLKVDLDKEMREVFDRLLATEEQIQAAEIRAKVEPMFTDAAMAGMTEEEFSDYQARQEKVKDVQSETLRDKIIKQLTRQTKAWWKEEKQDIIDEEITSLKTQQVYLARERLKTGDLKIDHATVKEIAGETRTDKRGRVSTVIPPKLIGLTAKGQAGVHPDEAAAFFGYNSGSEMMHELINAPPIQDKAEANAEARMIETHGDILTDGTIQREADEAVQNEERGKLILSELKIVSRGTNVPTIDRETIKTVAATNIGKLSFRQIHPAKYRRAEIRAAQEASRMLAENNREGAAAAKMRQVMNYYLGMAATAAKNDTTKIVDRMSRYNKKKVREEIQKAEGGYWDQITKILNRFEFRKTATLKEVENINTWAKERIETDGDGLVLSNAVLNESYVTHWKNVPFTDLQGINDSVKNIEHVARYANKLTRVGEQIDFNKLVDRWVTSMNDKVKTRFVSKRVDVAEGRNWGRWFMSQMTKIPFMASWLDGGERVGISHQIMVQPMTDAYNAELQMWEKTAKPVMDAIVGRSKEDQKRHNRKLYIPEIDDNLYGHQVIAVALNTGNQSNIRKLVLGEGWADPDVEAEITFDNSKLQAVLSHMTKSDWELVQKIWDQMETLYPELAEVHRRTTGLTPPKVESTPITTRFGTFRGGYYPVKYDPNRDFRAALNEDKLNAETESMFSNNASIQASVNTGATNERTGYYAPIRLSLDVVSAHFQETIHYITHHDPVREINRLTRNKAVAETIKEKLGPEEYAQLRPWLNDIAKDGRETPVKMFWDDMLGKLRFGVTLGAMGFKVSTGIIQISGLFNTMSEVGAKKTFQGLSGAVGHSRMMNAMRRTLGSTTDMHSSWEFAVENSQVLNHRVQTMDREIKNAMKRIEGKRGLLAAAQEVSMKHIALIQTYMVDLPSWHAAYAKGLEQWGDETRAFQYADWVVENVQGSGATKDMAKIMRGQSETGRMFTMFMTFFSSLWNMERDLVKGAKTGLYSTSSVAAKMMFLFTLPVLFEMVMRDKLDEPEDDDDRLQKMLTATAMYPVQSVPFVRDVANAVTGDFGYNISPLQSIIEQGTRTIPELITRGFTDEEITKGQIKGATKFVGAALGVPGTGQAWATGEHLHAVLEEGEEFTVHQLLFGPKRE